MYTLNEKLSGLSPYAPNEGTYRVRLDANESFLELPEALRASLARELLALPLNRYPDPEAKALRASFSARYGVPAENVAAGNGSDELISVLLQAFLMKGETAAVLPPDFSMYGFYAYLAECRCIEIGKDENFEADIDKTIEICNNEHVRLLIFSNPCNPTGRGVPKAEILRLADSVSALVVVDEAYMDFWDESVLSDAVSRDNLLVLRTCSKAFGLAALRVGFAVGNTSLIRAILAAKSPYNVNALSQCAAAAVLREKALCDAAIREIISSRESLQEALSALAVRCGGFTVVPSCANFVTVRLKDPDALYWALGEAGVAVRCFSAIGAVRITAGTTEENDTLLQAMRRYFAA